MQICYIIEDKTTNGILPSREIVRKGFAIVLIYAKTVSESFEKIRYGFLVIF